VSDSILETTKKNLGIAPEYKAFDLDIITHINSALSVLEQIGVGPVGGLFITDETETWDHLLGSDPRLNAVKTLVYLKVRLIFDPPATSFVIAAFEKQIEELTWRVNMVHEQTFVEVQQALIPVLEDDYI
jgi:hypothetical protein